MKIEIAIPNNFIAERTYAVKVLFDTFLGVDYEIVPRIGIKDYIIKVQGSKKIIIQDHFFSQINEQDGYLKKQFLPQSASLTDYKNDLPEAVIIFGDNYFAKAEENTIIGLDLFASSFFMLSRWEEVVTKERDSHQRFPVESAFAYQNNFLHRPLVNEYAELLKALLLDSGFEGAFRKHDFELMLTHDVDHIRYWKSEAQMRRQVGGDILKRLSPFKALSSYTAYKKVTSGKINDPYDTFDWLMTQSENVNIKARFYFIAGGNTEHEGNYDIRSIEVKKLIDEIRERGHIIGIHPSYATYLDVDMLRQEKEVLEDIVGSEITEGRQHYLRFSVSETWQNWEDVGLSIDSTLNYAGHEGFRCGTGNEFPVFNVLTSKELKLKERPLVLMDTNPLTHGFSDIFTSYDELNSYMIDTARNYKMPFTVLFHNSVFEMYRSHKLEKVYTELIGKI